MKDKEMHPFFKGVIGVWAVTGVVLAVVGWAALCEFVFDTTGSDWTAGFVAITGLSLLVGFITWLYHKL